MFYDEIEQKDVPISQIREIAAECMPLINFLTMVESGFITISVTEYQLLPSPAILCWEILKTERNKK